MKPNNDTPSIRFAGFTDAWEQRKLGELCDVFRSGEFIKASDIYVDGAFPVYGGNGLRGHADRFNYDGNYALIGRQGALCGNMNFSSGKAYFTEHAVAVHANDNNNTRFLFYLLDTMNLGQYSAQSAQPGLAVNKLITLPALCPSKLEQETIAEFLTRLDTLITLHQRKYDQLVNIKKSMLEKMFPKNGELVPEVRFAGFTDAWEQRKLGELGSLKNGMNFSKDAMGVGYSFVNLQNIFGRNVIDCMNLGKAMASPAQLKDYSLQEGDVLFVRSSVKLEGVGEAALVPNNLENTTYSGFIIRFRDEYGLANDYKRFAFSTDCVREQIMAQATDSANKNISQSVLSNLTIFVPQREEQEQIGSFFSRLDTLITLHQRKLERLQNIKKACLKKMFV